MIGQTINDRYQITARLGKGAMGTVYRATDNQRGHEVALKVISSDLVIDTDVLERFKREGEALRQLKHPNIVGFIDAFHHDEQYVIVMEYVSGGSLHDLIKAGPLPIEQIRQISLDLCDALIRAHRLNIIHRDLKPENILIDEDGTPRLADFGVARLSEGTRMTRSGTQVGTPYYMSPEAWKGETLDGQADIWSLGVVMFEMLSGQVPFEGDTGHAVMTKVFTTTLPDLKKLRSDIPSAFVKIVNSMLTREKKRRYQTMREVAFNLERSQQATIPKPSKVQQVATSNYRLVFFVGLLVVGAILGINQLSGLTFVSPEQVTTETPGITVTTSAITQITPSLAIPPELPQELQDLKVNIGAYPETLDPQKAATLNSVAFLNLIYVGLTTLNEKLETVPAAAESWEYNQDATELTFKLRDNLEYSDGTILNAKRFEFSLIRNIDPSTGGLIASITDEIIGATDWRSADTAASNYDAEAFKSGLGIKAMHEDGFECTGYDDTLCNTLQLSFTKPAPYFHTVMTTWLTYPAKEENIQNGGENWWNSSLYQIGNGPFIIEVLEPSVRTHFAPNPLFINTAPSYNLEFRYITDSIAALDAYKNNELDIINLSGQDLNSINSDAELNSQVAISSGSCTVVWKFGLEGRYTGTSGQSFASPFRDPKVREAFALGFDAENYTKEVDGGLTIPTWTWIPVGYPGFDSNTPLEFNPVRAQQALAESTYGGPEALNALGLKLTISDSEIDRTRGEFIINNYKDVLGINISLDAIDSSAFVNVRQDSQTFPLLVRQGWCDDFPDPFNWLSSYWKSDSIIAQRQGYYNSTLEDILNEADQSIDETRRMELYKQAQQELLNDFPAAFGYNTANAYLVKPWVRDIVTTPHDALWPGSIVPWTITIDESMKP